MMKNQYADIVLQGRLMKMVDYDKILNQLEDNKRLHEKVVKDGIDKLNRKLRSDMYTVDNIVANSGLGYKYHDLIDHKDKMNSDLKRNVNKSFHQVDVELYKLNNKLENESRMINYRYENKKENLLNQIKYKCQQ